MERVPILGALLLSLACGYVSVVWLTSGELRPTSAAAMGSPAPDHDIAFMTWEWHLSH